MCSVVNISKNNTWALAQKVSVETDSKFTFGILFF